MNHTSAKAINPLIRGLGTDGELIVAAVSDEKLDWSAMDFLMGPNAVKGTFTDIHEMEAAVRFSILTDVRPMIEVFPCMYNYRRKFGKPHSLALSMQQVQA